jgi:DNA-binding IclR family transcriptional regulator
MSSDGVAAVDRALEILGAFSERDSSLTLTELANRTGFYKSTVLRLIESLEKYNYIQRTQDSAYRLGPKTLYLGDIYKRHFSPSQYVPQALRRMGEELHETVSFYIREGDFRVCLHRCEADRAIRASVHEGNRLALNVGAGGHVMLAFSGLSGEKYDRIRDTMFAASYGERDPETAAVACPVLGVRNELVGVLNVSGPRYRIEKASLETTVAILFKYAAELTQQCGGDASVFERAQRPG